MRRIQMALLVGAMAIASVAGAATVQLTAILDDAQETTCAMASSARGVGTFALNDLTGELWTSVTFGNNAPDYDDGALALGAEIGAHLHGPAAPGATAGIVGGLLSGSPKESTSFHTPSQVDEIKAGLWYVNIHSTVCPGGEIRGQIVPVVGGDTIVGVYASKLIVIDKLATSASAKAVYVSKDSLSGITKGGGTDPTTISATFGMLATTPGSAAGEFVIPFGAFDGTSGWTTNKATIAKYVNKSAPGGATGAKAVVVKPGSLLKVVGTSLGDVPFEVAGLAPNNQFVFTSFRVVNGGEATNHCTAFHPGACTVKLIGGGLGAKLVCKRGFPEGHFPDGNCTASVASPSGAFLDE